MEQKNDAAWFGERLGALGMTPESLADIMLANGDTRSRPAVLQALTAIGAGTAALSDEMRVVLSLLGGGATLSEDNRGVGVVSPGLVGEV